MSSYPKTVLKQSNACMALYNKKLQGDAKYHADYIRFMTELIEKGYAQKVKVEELPH